MAALDELLSEIDARGKIKLSDPRLVGMPSDGLAQLMDALAEKRPMAPELRSQVLRKLVEAAGKPAPQAEGSPQAEAAPQGEIGPVGGFPRKGHETSNAYFEPGVLQPQTEDTSYRLPPYTKLGENVPGVPQDVVQALPLPLRYGVDKAFKYGGAVGPGIIGELPDLARSVAWQFDKNRAAPLREGEGLESVLRGDLPPTGDDALSFLGQGATRARQDALDARRTASGRDLLPYVQVGENAIVPRDSWLRTVGEGLADAPEMFSNVMGLISGAGAGALAAANRLKGLRGVKGAALAAGKKLGGVPSGVWVDEAADAPMAARQTTAIPPTVARPPATPAAEPAFSPDIGTNPRIQPPLAQGAPEGVWQDLAQPVPARRPYMVEKPVDAKADVHISNWPGVDKEPMVSMREMQDRIAASLGNRQSIPPMDALAKQGKEAQAMGIGAGDRGASWSGPVNAPKAAPPPQSPGDSGLWGKLDQNFKERPALREEVSYPSFEKSAPNVSPEDFARSMGYGEPNEYAAGLEGMADVAEEARRRLRGL